MKRVVRHVSAFSQHSFDSDTVHIFGSRQKPTFVHNIRYNTRSCGVSKKVRCCGIESVHADYKAITISSQCPSFPPQNLQILFVAAEDSCEFFAKWWKFVHITHKHILILAYAPRFNFV